MEPGRLGLKLTIDQVSRLTGVKKVTLRYWEKPFAPYLNPDRTGSQRREYTMADLDTIGIIKNLLGEEHLTNQGVMLRLRQRNQE